MRLCYHTKEAIMEREHWKQLYALAERLGKTRQDRGRYTTAFIVAVFLWAVVHDRPVSWACRGENWPEELRPRRLPSQSTMSRRLRCASATELLAAMEAAFQEPSRENVVEIIDAKPLPEAVTARPRMFAGGVRLAEVGRDTSSSRSGE